MLAALRSAAAVSVRDRATRGGWLAIQFSAGAAPWHDALEVLERLAARLQAPSHVFRSLDAWDICALIARSRGFCASSLHGRIVAGAFGRARVDVAHPSVRIDATKQHAYAATWEIETQARVVAVQALGDGFRAALSRDRTTRERRSAETRRPLPQRIRCNPLGAGADVNVPLSI